MAIELLCKLCLSDMLKGQALPLHSSIIQRLHSKLVSHLSIGTGLPGTKIDFRLQDISFLTKVEKTTDNF